MTRQELRERIALAIGWQRHEVTDINTGEIIHCWLNPAGFEEWDVYTWDLDNQQAYKLLKHSEVKKWSMTGDNSSTVVTLIRQDNKVCHQVSNIAYDQATCICLAMLDLLTNKVMWRRDVIDE